MLAGEGLARRWPRGGPEVARSRREAPAAVLAAGMAPLKCSTNGVAFKCLTRFPGMI